MLDQAAVDAAAQAYAEMKRDMSESWRTPVSDGRRKRKVVTYDPQGREVSWEEHHEEDAAGQPGAQREGDVCTINGAPGHLDHRLVCQPDRQDAAAGLKRKQEAYDAMVADMCDAWRTRA